MFGLKQISTLTLLFGGAAAQLSSSCTTVRDYSQRVRITTTLPVSTQTIDVFTTATTTVTGTIRAPRTIYFTDVETSVESTIVTASTPTTSMTSTPTVFTVTVPTTTTSVPTFTPSTITTLVLSPSSTVTSTTTVNMDPPAPTLDAAVAPLSRRALATGDNSGQVAAQLAARAQQMGSINARAVPMAELEKRQRVLGLTVICQATTSTTQTLPAPTPFTVTELTLDRPTARRTTTFVFSVTSTMTPTGTQTVVETASPVTSTLTATETVTSTVTPTAVTTTTVTSEVQAPDATAFVEKKAYLTQCNRPRFIGNNFREIQANAARRMIGTVSPVDNQDDCCNLAAAVPGAVAWTLENNGNCFVQTYNLDQCVAGSITTIIPFGMYVGPDPSVFTYYFGLLQCAVSFRRETDEDAPIGMIVQG